MAASNDSTLGGVGSYSGVADLLASEDRKPGDEGKKPSSTKLLSTSFHKGINTTRHQQVDALFSIGYMFQEITIEPAFTLKTRNSKDSWADSWSGWRDFSEMEYGVILRFGILI